MSYDYFLLTLSRGTDCLDEGYSLHTEKQTNQCTLTI